MVMDKKTYTGHPISVAWEKTDLHEVFDGFRDISGLNIIIDSDVKGSITLKLEEVPWDQVLDLILQQRRLGYELHDNIIRVARLPTLIREVGEHSEIERQKALVGNTVRNIYTLRHHHAGTMRDVLVQTVVTPRGYVIADPRTNSLIVTDLPRVQIEVSDMIARLDVPVASPPAEAAANDTVTSRGVVIVQNVQVQGDSMQQNIGRNDGTAIQAGRFQGSAIGRIVGSRMTGSLNHVMQSPASPELKDALKTLHVAVEELLVDLPSGVNAEDVANQLETLSRQAVERQPIRDIIKVTGQGLMDAARAVGAAGALAEAVRKVAELLGFQELL